MNGTLFTLFFLIIFSPSLVSATPSTIIWIPSVDIQPYKKVHFGLDTYVKTAKQDSISEPTVTNMGFTVGILPFKNVQMELGCDLRDVGGDHTYPLLFNGKIGMPEGSLFKEAPAFVLGGYDFGTKGNVTDFNITYLLIAKTLPFIGRLSLGYYKGNEALLVNRFGNKEEKGLLLAWDRVITEISNRLWLAIDYQEGKSLYGALSFGAAWKVYPEFSILFGYMIFNEPFYQPTFTVQFDVDF